MCCLSTVETPGDCTWLSQDAKDLVPLLAAPWLAVYPDALHGVIMSEMVSVLSLVENFLVNS